MHRKENFLPFFLVFFGLSLFLIFIGRSGISNSITSFFNKTTSPVKYSTSLFALNRFQNKTIKELAWENTKLKQELQIKKELINENNALKNQFRISEDKAQSQIPAKVVGQPGFIPGISLPEYLIIDKGYKSGVWDGSGVVVGNNIIGRVVKTYPDFSKIELITNKNSSFTAKISGKEQVNGVIKGQEGEEMVFDNVLLAAELKKGEEVFTKGDRKEDGKGYPPDLSVGKIVSIEKEESDLFQRAKVVSPVDFKNLYMVFVLKEW